MRQGSKSTNRGGEQHSVQTEQHEVIGLMMEGYLETQQVADQAVRKRAV